MKPCPKCSHLCPQDAIFCLKCGSKFQQNVVSSNGRKIFVRFVQAIGIVLFVFALIGQQRQNNQQKPSTVASPSVSVSTPEPTSTPFPVDNSWMWNEAENETKIKNAFTEPFKYLDDDDTKNKGIFRSLYNQFVKASSKDDLRDLSKKILAAKPRIEKANLDLTLKALISDDLNIAKDEIDQRIQHLGEPSTSQSKIAEVPMPPEPVTVEYQIITGTNMKWSATYENDQGGTEQITDGVGSWKKKLKVPRGSYLYLSAQNSEEFGGILVYITVNGEEVKRSEGSGGYSIASASYTVPDK